MSQTLSRTVSELIIEKYSSKITDLKERCQSHAG